MTQSVEWAATVNSLAINRPWLPRLLRVLGTVALCAMAWTWLAARVDLSVLAAQARQLPPWSWILAGAGLLAGHGMRALRLQLEWRHISLVPWLQCLRIVLAHNAMVLMLPLRSGEAVYLWAVRQQWGVDLSSAALALLRWRLQDAAVLAVLAVALLVPLPFPQRLLLALAVAAVLGGLLPPLWSMLVTRAAPRGAALPSGRGPWSGVGASAANWSLKVLANGALLAALAGLSLDGALRGALGGELAGVQPFQPPAGLGTYEGGIWLAAQLPSSMTSRLVAAALAVHAFSLVVALGAAALSGLPAKSRITGKGL
jgi:hypothetical protein